MKIKILMITHNRPRYTELTLTRLCESVPDFATITVWDNGSAEETLRVIRRFENHRNIEMVIYNKRNDKLRLPTNWFWRNSEDANFLSKVDDDCLVPKNWCNTLVQAHLDIPSAGVLGCWRFYPEDFDKETASKKIHRFGNHRILRNCWVEGSGYLMKRAVVEKIGYLRRKETFPNYCTRASANGFINGWYYPFLHQEHMDDPRSKYTDIRSESDFQRSKCLTAKDFSINSRQDRITQIRRMAEKVQAYSIDPYDFIGIRAKAKRSISRLLGREYFPKYNDEQIDSLEIRS